MTQGGSDFNVKGGQFCLTNNKELFNSHGPFFNGVPGMNFQK